MLNIYVLPSFEHLKKYVSLKLFWKKLSQSWKRGRSSDFYGTFRKHIANTGFADYSLRMFCLAEGRKAHWALLTGLLWVSGPDSCPAATCSSAATDCPAAANSPAAAGSSAAAAVDLAGREKKLEPGGQLMLLARQSKSLVQGGASEYSSTVLWIRTRIQEGQKAIKGRM